MAGFRTPKLPLTFPDSEETTTRAVKEMQRWCQEVITLLDTTNKRLNSLERVAPLAYGQLRTDGAGGWTLTGENVDPLRVELVASPSEVFIPFKTPVESRNYIVMLTKANNSPLERVCVDTNIDLTTTGFWVRVTTHNQSDFDPNTNEVGFNFYVRRAAIEIA